MKHIKAQGAKVLFFDLAGTVLDSAAGIIESLTFAIREQGHDYRPDAAVRTLFGPPMSQIVAQLLEPFGDDRVTRCVDLYREHYRTQGLHNAAPYPGIREALALLAARGYGLFVVTSKRQVFADAMLHNAALHGAFQGVFGTSPDGALDDKAVLLGQVIATLRQMPACAFMVGDKRDDMLAARRNAVPPLGALWGYGSRAELEDGGAVELVDSPTELASVIERLERAQ